MGFVSDILLSTTPSRGAGARLTTALREAVDSGRLPAGTRLPSTRLLAADLGLSRGVVVAAYEQLVAEGRLVARPGSGTAVAGLPRPAPVDGPAASPAPGLHLVVEFDEGTDDVAIVEAVRPLGLGPLALSPLRLGTVGPPGLVLGYAAQTPDELRAAVRRLSTVVTGPTRP